MRHLPDGVMIFCAGRGTRMKHFTEASPKPLIEVAGKALVEHAVEQLPAGLEKWGNTHHFSSKMTHALTNLGIHAINEETLLETGGGLKNMLKASGLVTVLTTNSDAVWLGPKASSILLDTWDPKAMDALLLTVPLHRTRAHLGQGDFSIEHDGKLSRKGEQVFTGVQIIKAEPVMAIKDDFFSLNIVWNKLRSAGRLYGVEYPGHWCDVGHPDGIVAAEKMLVESHV